MLSFLNKYAGNVHSQNGEDLIVAEIFSRIPPELHDGYQFNGEADAEHPYLGHAVEIGGNDGHWMSNIRNLIEQGWSGVFVETSHELWKQCRDNWANNPKVKCINSHVDTYNVNAFVKSDCDLVSFDTDGSDFELWASLKYETKPKVIIIEIDSSLEPGTLARDDGFLGTYSNTVTLGIYKGYFLLCHTGNLVFVDNKYRDLFPEIVGDGLTNSELYFKRDWVKKDAA